MRSSTSWVVARLPADWSTKRRSGAGAGHGACGRCPTLSTPRSCACRTGRRDPRRAASPGNRSRAPSVVGPVRFSACRTRARRIALPTRRHECFGHGRSGPGPGAVPARASEPVRRAPVAITRPLPRALREPVGRARALADPERRGRRLRGLDRRGRAAPDRRRAARCGRRAPRRTRSRPILAPRAPRRGKRAPRPRLRRQRGGTLVRAARGRPGTDVGRDRDAARGRDRRDGGVERSGGAHPRRGSGSGRPAGRLDRRDAAHRRRRGGALAPRVPRAAAARRAHRAAGRRHALGGHPAPAAKGRRCAGSSGCRRGVAGPSAS